MGLGTVREWGRSLDPQPAIGIIMFIVLFKFLSLRLRNAYDYLFVGDVLNNLARVGRSKNTVNAPYKTTPANANGQKEGDTV